MRFSKLKHEIEMLELSHKHQMEVMKSRHRMEISELKNKCTHKYDDGTPARKFAGVQWDNWTECAICGKTL